MLDAYRAGRMPQAWILGGPQGIGKATLAWRMARFLAAHPDPCRAGRPASAKISLSIRTSGGAENVGAVLRRPRLAAAAMERKDQETCDADHASTTCATRSICSNSQRARAAGDGDHRQRRRPQCNSANALLKLIEEPPPRCLFLLIAHRPGRLLPTITFAVPDVDAAKPRAGRSSTPPCAKRSTRSGKRVESRLSPKPAPARKAPCMRRCA